MKASRLEIDKLGVLISDPHLTDQDYDKSMRLLDRLGSAPALETDAVTTIFRSVRDPAGPADSDHLNAELATFITSSNSTVWIDVLLDMIPEMSTRAPGFMLDLVGLACLKNEAELIHRFKGRCSADRQRIWPAMNSARGILDALQQGRYTKSFLSELLAEESRERS